MNAAVVPRLLVPDLERQERPHAPPPGSRFVRLTGATMGTGWALSAYLPDGQAGPVVCDALQAEFSRLSAIFSHWDSESEICRFNAAPASSRVEVSDDFLVVVGLAHAISVASGGAFNPLLGQLTAGFGFDPQPSVMNGPGGVGDGRDIDFDAEQKTVRRPDAGRLDLNAIAKGYALDQSGRILRGLGIAVFLLEIGGEFLAAGIRHDLSPWWVDLALPGVPVIARVALVDQALAGASVASPDRSVAQHILSETPAPERTSAAWVLSARCAAADAWATALCAMDDCGARRAAREADLTCLVLDSRGRVRSSASALAMMRDQ